MARGGNAASGEERYLDTPYGARGFRWPFGSPGAFKAARPVGTLA